MEAVSKLEKRYQVMVSDVDFTKKLKLSAAFNYFQEIASIHSDNLGIGFNTIDKKFGVAWVLTRMRVDIMRYPVWNEEVVIETWPQLPKKIEFERDYLMKDLAGNVIARAVSNWVIIDIKARKICKSDTIAIDYPQIFTERAIDCKLGKFEAAGAPKLVYKRVIGCSDIDINGHLNNSKYIDFIMDCFSFENYQRYHAKSIQVNYINEALPGDTISLYKDITALDERMVYIEGINDQDGKVIFKSQILIEES